MITKLNNIGIFSDLHFCHKNIHKYEKDKRNKIDSLFGIEYLENDLYWKNFTKKIINYIDSFKERNNISYFINLGDFIFHPTEDKLNVIGKNNLYKLLKDNIFILGNHDLKKKQDYNLINFNKDGDILFENINDFKTGIIKDFSKLSKGFKVFHIIENKNKKEIYIFTHYPLYSTLTEEYNIHNLFKQIDKYLIKLINNEYKNYYIVNYHGHIHSNKVDIQGNNVRYINCCIDYNI